MFDFISRLSNRLFLKYRCQYLRTDDYQNRIFQAPYFDPEVVKIITIPPGEKNYLISYHLWFETSCFFEEYLNNTDHISG